MQDAPDKKVIAAAVEAGRQAAASAKQVRGRLRRRKTVMRDQQLAAARDRCAEAAIPLRSFIGMIAWHDIPVDQELEMKDAIADLRYERRQITKML